MSNVNSILSFSYKGCYSNSMSYHLPWSCLEEEKNYHIIGFRGESQMCHIDLESCMKMNIL